jgi:acyl-[acyl carrier protein]--UDP-N-acetylglucosamine O-acyltransferase
MKFCAQKMFEFDKILNQMGLQKHAIAEEQAFMAMLTKKYKKKFYDEEEVHKMAEEPSKLYSDNQEIQNIVA